MAGSPPSLTRYEDEMNKRKAAEKELVTLKEVGTNENSPGLVPQGPGPKAGTFCLLALLLGSNHWHRQKHPGASSEGLEESSTGLELWRAALTPFLMWTLLTRPRRSFRPMCIL